MRVALLTAKPNRDRRVGGHRMYVGEKRPPHGIGYLWSVLAQAGIHADIYDRYCGDTRWPRDGFASYDFLGVYCASICTDDIRWILTRARAPRIAVGGPHAYLHPDWFPDSVDHIVRGEAEECIVDLVAGRVTERVIVPPRLSNEQLDALPRFPFEQFLGERRGLYDWGFSYDPVHPVFTLNTSRGCPFNCSFCSVKQIWGRKTTFMSAERILDDIRHCVSLGARGIYFREDNFTAHKGRVRRLCELLLEHDVRVGWTCETRVDSADDEAVALMKRAGCVGVYVGVEHLTQHMLDVFEKGVTVEQILRFFESANRHGLFTHASFVVDHPEETAEDRAEKARLLPVIRPSKVVDNRYRNEFDGG